MTVIRTDPRISLFKLAEYAVASPRRRRSILNGQARPRRTVVPLYRRAEAAAVRFLRGRGDRAPIEQAIEMLEAATPSTEWDARDLRNSIAALERLLRIGSSLDLGRRNLRFRRGNGGVFISGVKVSVRPHILVWREGSSQSEIGAVKLSFLKTHCVTGEEAQYAATLVRRFLTRALPRVSIAPDLCQVVDLFGQEVTTAPAAFKNRMKDLRACCEEIQLAWPERRPPPRRPPAPSTQPMPS
jgi:hypothetical protein